MSNRRARICAVLTVLWGHGQDMAPFPLGQDTVRTTVFRGRDLFYEVIDGMAVHAEDIGLCTVEEAATGRNHKGGTNYHEWEIDPLEIFVFAPTRDTGHGLPDDLDRGYSSDI